VSYAITNYNGIGYSTPKRGAVKNPSKSFWICDASDIYTYIGFSDSTPERLGYLHSDKFNALITDMHVESAFEMDPVINMQP
jgi:hypothetical protein